MLDVLVGADRPILLCKTGKSLIRYCAASRSIWPQPCWWRVEMAFLTRTDLSKFFTVLVRRLPCPVRLIITGGIEAMLLGGTRPTGDIDFGLTVLKQ